jgi:hypothetical protein
MPAFRDRLHGYQLTEEELLSWQRAFEILRIPNGPELSGEFDVFKT